MKQVDSLLKRWKKSNKLTFKKIASIWNITPVYADYLVNQKRTPSPKLAKRISETTGIPVIDLLYPEERAG